MSPISHRESEATAARFNSDPEKLDIFNRLRKGSLSCSRERVVARLLCKLGVARRCELRGSHDTSYPTETQQNVAGGMRQLRGAMSGILAVLFIDNSPDLHYYLTSEPSRRIPRVPCLSNAPVRPARRTSRYRPLRAPLTLYSEGERPSIKLNFMFRLPQRSGFPGGEVYHRMEHLQTLRRH